MHSSRTGRRPSNRFPPGCPPLIGRPTVSNVLSPGSVEGTADGLVIHGGMPVQTGRVQSYDDHRMAMSLAVIGLAGKGVTIAHGGCVKISYPDFYDTLTALQE